MRRRQFGASSREIYTTIVAIALALILAGVGAAEEPRPLRTFFVTRSLAHERLLEYLDAAQPEIVQFGNYGAMFHGYADHPRATKTPMMLPVVGEREALEFQRRLNGQVHDRGLKVVGHFRLVKVMGEWQEKSGFVDYYNNRWPKDLLGPNSPLKNGRNRLGCTATVG